MSEHEDSIDGLRTCLCADPENCTQPVPGYICKAQHMKRRPGDQPLPTHNDQPAVQDLVIADIEARKKIGLQRYGTLLQAFNGRNALRDAYEEAIDLAVYLRQCLAEEEARSASVTQITGLRLHPWFYQMSEPRRDTDGWRWKCERCRTDNPETCARCACGTLAPTGGPSEAVKVSTLPRCTALVSRGGKIEPCGAVVVISDGKCLQGHSHGPR